MLLKFSPNQKSRLSEFASNVDFEHLDAKSIDTLEDYDIIIGNPRRSLVQTAKRLKWLQLFKPGAVFLNAGRGATVDTNALIRALKCGLLSGAVLDVFEEEPLSPEHELWGVKNVIMTPHVAGWHDAPFTDDKIYDIIIENTRRFISGARMRNLVEVY